jgi:nicotinate phosphoribosyltransferase
MATAANGRFLAEMGSRRVNENSAVASARAAFIAGFDASSNLEAGRSWGVPTMGTAAHAFTLLHDSEEQAFKAQLETFGEKTTLLVDTFDIEAAVRMAIALAPKLGAVRIDSGDLGVEVKRVRELLDSLGAREPLLRWLHRRLTPMELALPWQPVRVPVQQVLFTNWFHTKTTAATGLM